MLPGPTRSEGIVEFLKGLASKPNATAARRRATSLLQRLIEPEEVADPVAFVASPRSAATNGSALRADGGVMPAIF